jgi:hypothetical protein
MREKTGTKWAAGEHGPGCKSATINLVYVAWVHFENRNTNHAAKIVKKINLCSILID